MIYVINAQIFNNNIGRKMKEENVTNNMNFFNSENFSRILNYPYLRIMNNPMSKLKQLTLFVMFVKDKVFRIK